MRVFFLLLPSLLCAADAPSQVTAADLQALVGCAARLTVAQLTPAEMQVVAVAIAHAQADIAEMQKPKSVPAPHSATAAAVKP